MLQETKVQIVAGVNEYIQAQKLTQNDVALKSGVNAGYVSQMLRGKFSTTVNDTETPIGDKHFYKLAEWAGLAIKKQYWKTINTTQFKQIIPALEQCRNTGRGATLICETGMGKSYIVDKYCKMNAHHTYRIVVNSQYRVNDILSDLLDMLGLETGWSAALKLRRIIKKLSELKRSGAKPVIIIDEAENLEMPTLKLMKGLYDGIKDHTAIVMIATPQLISKLEKMKKRDLPGIPQFCRRIKAGIRYISNEKNFTPFFEEYVPDKGLRKLLNQLCDNYGELNDYLEPALREADELDQPLTEGLFRIMFNLQN